VLIAQLVHPLSPELLVKHLLLLLSVPELALVLLLPHLQALPPLVELVQ